MAQKTDIIKSVARNLGDLILDGVPASLTGSTVDHLDLIQPLSEQLRGKHFYAYSGAGAGQARVVGSYVPANHRLVFARAFASIPSVNTNFILTDYFAKSDIENAVDRFVGIAKQRFLQDVVATMQFIGSQYEYPVPSGFDWISNIRLVPSNATDYAGDDEVDRIFEIPPRYFRVEKNVGGSYVIAFDPRKINIDASVDEEMARIHGQAKPEVQATDNATIPEELEEFLIAGASMHLSAQRIADGKEFERLFYMYRDELRGIGGKPGLEEYIFRYGRGKQVGT